jgi:hypothetical protein
MVIHGKKIIIKYNGTAIAAAKSCSVNIGTDMQEVSSASDGQWEHYIAGRKSWSFSTDHLVVPSQKTYHMIEAVSVSNGSTDHPRIIADGVVTTSNLQSRGVALSVYNLTSGAYVLAGTSVFDTYNDPTGEGASFVGMLTAVDSGAIVVITSFDSLSITSAMRTALLSGFTNLTEADIPLITSQRGAFVLIGRKAAQAICMSNIGEDNNVHVSLNINKEGFPLSCTPTKDILTKSGAVFNVVIQTEGYALDVLRGSAICNKADIKSNTSNLLQGSFSFKGTGPLT